MLKINWKNILEQTISGIIVIGFIALVTFVLPSLLQTSSPIGLILQQIYIFINAKILTPIEIIFILGALYLFSKPFSFSELLAQFKKKESREYIEGVLNIGDEIKMEGNIRFRLDDISRPEGILQRHSAILSVVDKKGDICQRLKIFQGGNKRVKIGRKEYYVKVGTVSAGLNFIAKWAELKVSNRF